MDYEDFIASKAASRRFEGIESTDLPSVMFPFQRDLTKWALRRGRAAIFAGTGLGKSLMELAWAREISKLGRVILVAPLAVAEQMIGESNKFDIPATYTRRGERCRSPITITNYELLRHFNADDFVGVILDESGIMKDFTGAMRNLLIEMFAETPYRLACTATPAPNDYTELGNHSEFLGIKTRTEMLAEYFVHDGETTQEWRLKRHAENDFWRWVCSWGAMISQPSDLGYENEGFDLPPLRMHDVRVDVGDSDFMAEGYLFPPAARTLSDQRTTRRATRNQRIGAAEKILLNHPSKPAVVWCELNTEQDEMSEALGSRAVSIYGSMTPEEKVSLHQEWIRGSVPFLVTKGSIFGHGMNWQHCARQVFLGSSHSFEMIYQSIRRCWRFGQTSPVDIYMISAATESAIVANYRRKEADFARMTGAMIEHMRDTMRAEISSAPREWNDYTAEVDMIIPEWLRREESACA